MRKFIFLLISVFIAINANSQIYQPEGLNMPGSWNGWQNPPTNALFLASATQVAGGWVHRIELGQPIYQTMFSTLPDGQLSGGGYRFLFTSGPSDNPWQNKWTDVVVQIDSLQTYIWHNDGGGSDDSVFLENNKFYVVNWEDLGYQDTKAIFMQLSSRPANIDTVLQYPAAVYDTDSVYISIQLDTTPAEEQKFFVRYTTDGWQTSNLAGFSATDSGLVAVIPPMSAGLSVNYYVFSTVFNNPTDNYDLITITFKNNNGQNYSYEVNSRTELDTNCDLRVSAVYPQPALPVEDSGVTIWFDATLGNGALANYQGDIYAHTGLITTQSPDSTYWVHIVSQWGQNLPQLKFTRVGTNLYKLRINNIRQFYGVTDTSEHVLKIAMVIRSAEPIDPDHPDDYIVARQEDGSDFFVKVYRSGQLAAKVVTPNKYHNLYANDEPVRICAYSLNADTTKLYVDDSLVAWTTTDSVSVLLDSGSLSQGNHYARVVAIRGSQTSQSRQIFLILPPVETAPMPANLGNGVTIRNDTVYFVLWDPPALKRFAFVIGDFNNWQPDVNYYMKRTPDGKHFWLAKTGFDPNTEYGYQFFIDGKLRLADPYAHKILDPWNDKYIPAYNYPNLKPYPYGKTYGIVSTFKINEDQYNWQVTNFTPTAIGERQPDLIVYELLVRDFVDSSALKDVTAKLDYIKNLGVNAIEIMPVNEFEGNLSWGYNPDFYFAVDKYYGTNNDFKHFVDECHRRGIAVILDVVFNHSFGLCPLVQMYWDSKNNRPSADNPWYNQVAPHPLSPGYDFNHESPYTKKFVKDVLKYWLTEFKVDGFRFDLSKGFTQRHTTDLSAWSAYDQSRINILEDYYDFIKSINPNAYVVLEHFADNDEEQVLANYGFILWQRMSEQYGQALMGWQDNSDFSWAYYQNRGFNYPNNLVFMESHDDERLIYKALQWGNHTSDYDVRQLDTALSRERGLVAFWATMPGPKMLWQFGELGYDYSINYCSPGVYSDDCRTSPKPVRWDYRLNPKRWKLYNTYRKLLYWKQTNPIFRLGNFSLNTSGYVKEQWISSDTFNIYVVGNFDVVSQSVNLHFQHTGTWYDVFNGTNLSVSSTSMSGTLAPGQFHIYADHPVNLVDALPAKVSQLRHRSKLFYPDPASDRIVLNNSRNGRIEVYTTSGRKVLQKNVSVGQSLDISRLQSGLYIVRFISTNTEQTQLLIKN